MPFLVFVVLESSAHSNFLQNIWVNQFNLFNKSQTFSNSPILFKTLSERSCKLAALLLHHSGIFKSRKKMQQSLSYSFDIGTEVCITINLCLLISMRCDKKSRGYLLKNSCMLIYTRVPSELCTISHLIWGNCSPLSWAPLQICNMGRQNKLRNIEDSFTYNIISKI